MSFPHIPQICKVDIGSVSQMGKLRGYLTAHSTLLEKRAGLCVLFLTVLVDSLTMGKAVSHDSDFIP